ncbi:hypothetical protein PFISCL1PPCAC_25840, partial [Pristionchus fissidentatus]
VIDQLALFEQKVEVNRDQKDPDDVLFGEIFKALETSCDNQVKNQAVQALNILQQRFCQMKNFENEEAMSVKVDQLSMATNIVENSGERTALPRLIRMEKREDESMFGVNV